MFLEANKAESEAIKNIIHLYGEVSIQVINLDKTEAYFGNCVGNDLQVEVAKILKVKVVECHDKYLGPGIML